MKNLIVTLIIVNILTVFVWMIFQKKLNIGHKTEYSATNNSSDYKYEILITRPWWQKFSTDEYFTPQFKIKIKNIGADINIGSLECDIAEHDDVSSFPTIKKFKDFQHFKINNFKHGEIREFDAVIRSKFLKPSNYMLRLKIIVWGPTGTPREEIVNQLKSNVDVDIEKIMNIVEHFWKSGNVDPDKVNPNQFKPYAIYDFRWLEVIKVHSTLPTLSTIFTILGASILGVVYLILSGIKRLFLSL